MEPLLTVNGVTQEITCDPSTPLLYILRNDLGLTGAKLGCGWGNAALCGNDRCEATFCCNRPVGEITEKDIVTVELSNDPVGAAVQRAFLAEGAAQCGYCTTGIVVAATSLLKKIRHPIATPSSRA